MDGGQGERSQPQPLGWQPALKRNPGRLATGEADGGEHADGLGPKTAQGEGQHRRRGRIQPLGIVDGNQQGAGRGQGAEHIQHGEPDGTPIGWLPLGLGQQQRHLERAPLGHGKSGQRLLQDPGQEVTEGGEGEPDLRASRPADKGPLPDCL